MHLLDAMFLIVALFVLVVPFEKLFPRHRGQRVRRQGLGTDLTFALATPLISGVGLVVAAVAGVVSLAWLPGLAPLAALTLGLFALLVTLGFSFALLELGRTLTQAARWRSSLWPVSPWIEASLGLVPFVASCAWFPLALIECLIGGAWGAGAIVLAWRAGRLRLPEQLLE